MSAANTIVTFSGPSISDCVRRYVGILRRRLGHAALRAFYEDIVPRLTIQWITEAAHARSVEGLLTAGRRKLSLVDCVSFHVMRQIGISTAFTFDRHFREQGFSVVPN